MIVQKLLAIVLPAILTGLVLVALLLLRRLKGVQALTPSRAAGAGALALAAGFMLGFWLVEGLPSAPPAESFQWLVYFAPLEAILGAVEVGWSPWAKRAWLLWPARIAALGGLVTLILAGLADSDVRMDVWGIASLWLLAPLVLVVGGSYMVGLEGLARRESQPSSLLALVIATGGASAAIGLSGTAKLAELCGLLTACLTALLILTWWKRDLAPARGVVPVLGLVFPGLLVATVSFASLPPLGGLLLALTPGAAWLSRAGPLGRLKGWQSLGIGLTGVVVLVSVAAALAHASAPEPYTPY